MANDKVELRQQTVTVWKFVLATCVVLLAAGRILIWFQVKFKAHDLIEEEIGTFLMAAFPIVMWLFLRLLSKIRRLPKVLAPILYFIVSSAYIIFTTEALFRYVFSADKYWFRSDLVSGLYMTAMSIVVLCLSITDGDSGKKESCALYAVAQTALWLLTQDRLRWIVRSVREYAIEEVDSMGFYLNWFTCRAQLLSMALFGTSEQIFNLRLSSLSMARCPLVWLRTDFGPGAAAAALVVAAVMLYALGSICREYNHTKYALLAKIIFISAATQTLIGVVGNLFMMYGSHVGLPGLHSIYTLIPVAAVLFLPHASEEKYEGEARILKFKRK